jgi:4-hydroxy-tetrahydrodipicolinate synthase
MKGVITAVVTPFKEDRSIDIEAFTKLILLQEEAKIDGVVIGGTTGEGWSLSKEEVKELTEVTKSHFTGKVIIGTGAISTAETVLKTENAKQLGADAALVIVPYYIFPTEKGVVEHFEEVAKVGLEIIVYHHPKRTGLKLSLDCLKNLCKIPNITAIKETSGDDDYIKVLSEHTKVFSGCDDEMKKAKSLGALGIISVISNLFPKETVDFFANESKDFEWFLQGMIPLLFREGNPSGIKAALKKKKILKDFLRKPLQPLTDKARDELVDFMEKIVHKEIANK